MIAGLIGLGKWGREILWILKTLERDIGYQIKYVCDERERGLEICEKGMPGLELFTDYREMLGSRKLDMVFITTSPESHYDISKNCLESNHHIYVTKPFVFDIDQANQLDDLAKTRNLVISVGYSLLYSPSVLFMMQKVFNNGVPVGTVLEAEWKSWYDHQKRGVHWDMGSEYIALMNYVTGDTPEVLGFNTVSRNTNGEVENGIIFLRYPGNITGKIDVSWTYPSKTKKLFIRFRNKLYMIDHDRDSEKVITVFDSVIQTGKDLESYHKLLQEKVYTRHYMNEAMAIDKLLKDFIRAIECKGQVKSSPVVAIKVIETLQELEKRSHRNGYSEPENLVRGISY